MEIKKELNSLVEGMGYLQIVEELAGNASIYPCANGVTVSINNWYSGFDKNATSAAKEALVRAADVIADVERVVDEGNILIYVGALSNVHVEVCVSSLAKIGLADLMRIANGRTVELDDTSGWINASILVECGENWSVGIEVYSIQC